MDKIKELLAKVFAPIIQQIGKLNFKKEKLIGVVLKEKELQICEIAQIKNKWKVLNFSNQKIAGIGEEQDIYSASTDLSDQIKNAMSSIKTKNKVVIIGFMNCPEIPSQKNFNSKNRATRIIFKILVKGYAV